MPTEVVQRLMDEMEQLEKAIANISDSNERYRLKDEGQRKLIGKWDESLYTTTEGPFYLRDDKIAAIVADSIRYHAGDWFDVEAYCIMPDHVHLVLTPYPDLETTDCGLTKITHNIERNSAKQANALLGRTGEFWQHESYDHFVRDAAEMERILKYVVYNPVKAGLVDDWTKWKWTYCKYDM